MSKMPQGVRLEGKQLEEFNQAFVIFDTEGKGKASREQAAAIIRAIGLSPTCSEMNEILGERERHFDQRELQHLIQTKSRPPESEESLREAFRIFDKDGSGYVDCKELRHVLCHLGEKLSDDQVDELIRELDTNGDSQIACDEFVRTMQSLS